MITFLDDIDVWYHVLTVLRCYWILNSTESIIIGILIEFSLVVMHPNSKFHVVYTMSCICLFIDVLAIKDSTAHQCYGNIFRSGLSKFFIKIYNRIWLHYRTKNFHASRKVRFVHFEGHNRNGDEIYFFIVHKDTPN